MTKRAVSLMISGLIILGGCTDISAPPKTTVVRHSDMQPIIALREDINLEIQQYFEKHPNERVLVGVLSVTDFNAVDGVADVVIRIGGQHDQVALIEGISAEVVEVRVGDIVRIKGDKDANVARKTLELPKELHLAPMFKRVVDSSGPMGIAIVEVRTKVFAYKRPAEGEVAISVGFAELLKDRSGSNAFIELAGR